jgi:uncharacterized repeat protein (TIGR04138 family)
LTTGIVPTAEDVMAVLKPELEGVVRRDPRFAYEAYEFLFLALAHTQKMLGRVPPEPAPEAEPAAAEPCYHVSGRELLEGVRALALEQFGLMARTVFRLWGINRTDDFGAIVFNLVEAGLMSKTDQDDLRDFHDVYDLDEALTRGYRIEVKDDLEAMP